jgi:hypothetical protein
MCSILKSFVSAAVVMLSVCTAFAQSADSTINTIRKEFELINVDTAMKTVVLDAEDFLYHTPCGGGSLTGYYSNGKLRKIVAWVGMSMGNETMEFYFKDERLLFVYEEFNSFHYNEVSQALHNDSLETSFTGRYYFASNKLKDYMATGHNTSESDTIDVESMLMGVAKVYKRKLNDRRKK